MRLDDYIGLILVSALLWALGAYVAAGRIWKLGLGKPPPSLWQRAIDPPVLILVSGVIASVVAYWKEHTVSEPAVWLILLSAGMIIASSSVWNRAFTNPIAPVFLVTFFFFAIAHLAGGLVRDIKDLEAGPVPENPRRFMFIESGNYDESEWLLLATPSDFFIFKRRASDEVVVLSKHDLLRIVQNGAN